jgi:peptide-methionine (S)-S-oxide reductase
MSWIDELRRVRTDKTRLIDATEALPGRTEPVLAPGARHLVSGNPLQPPFPDGLQTLVVAGGCFWGFEEIFWQLPGVYSTSAGYAGGTTPNPTYEEVCSGRTGHTESVLVVFDPARITLERLLAVFWESHDPTLGMRQGNDIGTQYRSAILYGDAEQEAAALASAQHYAARLHAAGIDDPITTEIAPLQTFYWAEDYHQQYLVRHPNGYRCHSAAGVRYDA